MDGTTVILKTRAKCRICGHAWVGDFECKVSKMGNIPPDDILCPHCGHRAADATPNADDSGAIVGERD